MRWEDVARRQGGVIARQQLVPIMGEDAIDGLIRRRDLTIVQPDVYRDRATPSMRLGDYWAAVLWSGGWLSHGSAGQVWRVPLLDPTQVQVTVRDLADRKPGGRGIKVHRVQCPEYDVTTHDGLPITTRDRTVIDMLGRMESSKGRVLLGEALEKEWVELWQLDRRLVDGRGRAGNVRIRTLRAEADPNWKSEFERRFIALLRQGGFTGWEPQFAITLRSGAVVHVDIAFPEQKLIVELDGWAWHGRERFGKDRKRWRGGVAVGWRVVQFTWDDLDHPARTLAELADLLAA